MYKKIFLIILLFYIIYIFYNINDVKYYNWDEINFSDIKFPKNFKWGTATSSYQIEGFNYHNQWYEWEQKSGIINGESTLHRLKYKEDIKLMKSLNLNSYRLSIEWSRIEKEQGIIEYEELKFYEDLIKYCLKKKIQPMITLFHWTLPKWFADIGGFEKEENSKYFINFAKLIYHKFNKKVKLWCITNEVLNYCNAAYNVGLFPPNIKDINLCMGVYWNLLTTQIDTYYELKKINSNCQIGFVKQYTLFRPYYKYNLMDVYFAKNLDELFNDVELKFYKSGEFIVNFKGLITTERHNLKAVQSFDFVGVNYYSHNYVHFNPFSENKVDLLMHPNEVATDFMHTIYPEGINQVIEKVSILNKPIYITENGMADEKDNRRGPYIQKIVYLLSELIKKGYDIRGYYHWTLVDNFEWNEGYHPKFGLFAMDQYKNRIMRNSAIIYKNIIKNSIN